MTALSELLVLLNDAHNRIRTVHGRYETREHRGLADWAHRRHFEPEAERGEDGPTAVRRAELWLEWPARVRADTFRSDSGEGRLTLTKGDELWEYFPESGVNRPVGGHARHVFGVDVFDPAFLLACARLEPVGPATVAGRAAVRARTTPRLDFLPDFVDDVGLIDEVAVDAERGTLLSCTWRLDGAELRHFAFTEIAFDEPIPSEVFEPDVPIEPREWDHDVPASVAASLSEAASLASFPVWALPDVPAGWTHEVRYQAGHPKRAEAVSIVYARSDALVRIGLSEEAATESSRRPGRDVETLSRGGREVDVESDRGVRVELDGTVVTIESELPVEELVDVATSLVRID